MSRLLSFLLLWTLAPVWLWGQSAQCPDVEISGAPQITFPCATGTQCTTLVATFPDIRQTVDAPNAYQVDDIAFSGHEPFQVAGATPILVNQDDVYSGVINLPFTFCFYGGQYTQVVVGANGTISFDASYAGNASFYSMCDGGIFSPANPYPIPSTAVSYPRNAIFACFHDINPIVPAANRGIEYALIGTAPCRKLVVNWRNIAQFSCTATTSTFQCVLYENTNVIEMYIEKKPVCANWNCGVAVVGVQNQARNQAVAAPGRNATVWTTTTANSEAWRFIPNGASLLNGVQLQDAAHNVVATGTAASTAAGVLSASFANVCVSGASAMFYIRADYTACSGSALSSIDSVVLARVSPPAAPAAPSPVNYCQGAVATALTATGVGLLWYTTANGGSGSASAPVPPTTTPGTTTWYVSQTVNGCEGVRTPVSVIVHPVANNAVSRQICPGNSFTFGGQTINSAGTYTGTFTGANGCDSIVTLTVTVGTTIQVNQNATICQGESFPFNGNTYNTAGSYSFTTMSSSGCDSTTTLQLTVNPQVTPAFTAIAPICSGAAAPVLPATSTNGITGTWSPATVSNTATGTYTFTPNAGQCATTATLTVTVNPLPAAPPVSTPLTYCQGAAAAVLTATGTALLWYDVPAGGTGTTAAPTPSTAVPGVVTWYVSQTVNGCEGPRSAIAIQVNPTPAMPVVTSPVQYCAGMPATALTATGSNLLWYTAQTGGAGSSTTPVPQTTTPGTTTWYVSQTQNDCESPRAAIVVTVYPVPEAPEVSSPVLYCQGDEPEPLGAVGSGLLWYTSATGGTGSGTAPVPLTSEAGTQSWHVSQSANGCESPRVQLDVIVNPNPVVDAKLEIVGTTMYLNTQVSGTNLSYAWTPSEGLSCTNCDRPQANPDRSTIYTVTVTTVAGCSATDTVGVYLDCNKIFIPNTFSPNGDGNNDRFFPMGLSLKTIKTFQVYNRWGELVYSRENIPANDPVYGWDGNYQSKAVKPDVFVYYLVATCVSGEEISRKGDVSIIR